MRTEKAFNRQSAKDAKSVRLLSGNHCAWRPGRLGGPRIFSVSQCLPSDPEDRGLGTRGCGEPGFTLIELLTVIAIILVLAAILVPTLVGVRGRGKKVEAQNMVKALELAMERFKLDHNQYPWAPPPNIPPNWDSADIIRELMADDPRITAGSVPTHNRTRRSYLTGVKNGYIKDGTLVDQG